MLASFFFSFFFSLCVCVVQALCLLHAQRSVPSKLMLTTYFSGHISWYVFQHSFCHCYSLIVFSSSLAKYYFVCHSTGAPVWTLFERISRFVGLLPYYPLAPISARLAAIQRLASTFLVKRPGAPSTAGQACYPPNQLQRSKREKASATAAAGGARPEDAWI